MKTDKSVAERRNVTPEFMAEVKHGLKAKGARCGDEAVATTAKALWTSKTIRVRVLYSREIATIDNPHFEGANLDEVENTIRRMAE
jgi:hypothetical protein